MMRSSASGTLHHLAMLATEELALEDMALAEEDRSRQGSHRGHAVDDEKFRVRNAPPSSDAGYRRTGTGRNGLG
jgi:seryl-tRNA(Sec) selenium transferase